MADVVTVDVTLAHPLTEDDSVRLGLAYGAYSVGQTVSAPLDAAHRLIMAGLTTIRPTDYAAISALFGTAIVNHQPSARLLPEGGAAGQYATPNATGDGYEWSGLPVHIGDNPPVNPPTRYVWFQTGLGTDQTGTTLWIEDGR